MKGLTYEYYRRKDEQRANRAAEGIEYNDVLKITYTDQFRQSTFKQPSKLNRLAAEYIIPDFSR